jgi:hypothetical protein
LRWARSGVRLPGSVVARWLTTPARLGRFQLAPVGFPILEDRAALHAETSRRARRPLVNLSDVSGPDPSGSKSRQKLALAGLPANAHPAGAAAFLAAAPTLRSTGSRLRAFPPVRSFSPSPAGAAGWRSTGKPPSELPPRPKWGRHSRVDASGCPAHRVVCRSLGESPLRPGWMPERPRCHATPVARRWLRGERLLTTPNDRKTGPSLRFVR